MPVSRFSLPVAAGKPYTVTLEVRVPEQAISPESGLYLDGKRIARLTGGNILTAALPPSPDDRVRLELHAAGGFRSGQPPAQMISANSACKSSR